MPTLSLLCLFLSLAGFDQGRVEASLPLDATVLETRSLAGSGVANRTLILWMVRAERRPSGYDKEDPYTCPDETRGSHFSGPTRLTLVDSASGKVLQTLNLVGPYDGADSLDLPYRIRPGHYYHVETVSNGSEGRPTLLWLRDYNGDGLAFEFALYDAPSCMGLQTTLIGYLPDEDRVVQYPIRVQLVTKGATTKATWYWLAYLFDKAPVTPGVWHYEVDYRGRGGVLERTDVHYDRASRSFEGVITQLE